MWVTTRVSPSTTRSNSSKRPPRSLSNSKQRVTTSSRTLLWIVQIMRETTINGEDGWQWICSRKISNPIQKSTNSFFVFFGSHILQGSGLNGNADDGYTAHGVVVTRSPTHCAVPCLKDDVPDIRCIDEMFRELLASESKAGLVLVVPPTRQGALQSTWN